jgi:hypothetical protein
MLPTRETLSVGEVYFRPEDSGAHDGKTCETGGENLSRDTKGWKQISAFTRFGIGNYFASLKDQALVTEVPEKWQS